MRSTTLPLAIAMTLLTAATIHGQTPSTGRIVGTIIDATSSALAGVTIEIAAGVDSRIAVTDENGHYAFENLGSATYLDVVHALGGGCSVRAERTRRRAHRVGQARSRLITV